MKMWKNVKVDPVNDRDLIFHDLIDECKHAAPGARLSYTLRGALEKYSRDVRRDIVNRVKVGCSPLFIACKKGQIEIVEYLVTVCFADIEQKGLYEVQEDRSTHVVTPLWCAAVSGKLPVVELLLKFGADINAVSDTGSTPVRSACFMTHFEIVKYLVEHGADINRPNYNGGTCLINSVQSANLCDFLLKNNADVNARDIQNKTALHYAIQEHRKLVLHFTLLLVLFGPRFGPDTCGKKTRFMVEFLAPCTCYNFRINKLEENLDQDTDWLYFKAATEEEGPYSSVMHMSRAVKLGKMPLVRKIAHTKPSLLEAENKENKTPLIQAIEMGDLPMIQLLITLGSNVNTPLHHNKRTPLMIAVYYGEIKISWILIEKGADGHSRDVNGLNILHYAVDSNRLESVKFCLKILKDLDLQDNNGWTALMRAVILGVSESIIDFLMEQGANQEIKDRYRLDFRRHRELLEEFKNL